MNYQFPAINNISQVLPLIADRSEFVVAEKEGGYTVVNYVVMMNDTFPPVVDTETAILRELRGMIFNTETGLPIARRLHKFFNVNEREETLINTVDFDQPHVILEKLDGSMITPFMTTAGIRWGTKMGVTDVAIPVEAFVAANPIYDTFARWAQSEGITPIFEWCSRKQTIVIDHPEDKLVLIAIRFNITGEYMPYDKMVEEVEDTGIPVVRAFEGTVENMQALVDYTRDLINIEGFVVRFDSGHMLKVKAEDYLRKHKAKDSMSREKNVIELIVSGNVDDVKSFLSPEDLKRLEKFEDEFWKGVRITTRELRHKRDRAGYELDRKTYAVDFVQQQPERFSRFLYKMFEDKSDVEVFEMVKDTILKSCGSQTKVDEVRWIFDCNWIEEKIDE